MRPLALPPGSAYGRPVRLDRRQKTYVALRGLAAVGFLVSALVLPRGVPAAVLCLACGLVAVLACLSTNAGGPGERAGSLAQARDYERVRAPQGDWPPFDPARVVEGELADQPRLRRTA